MATQAPKASFRNKSDKAVPNRAKMHSPETCSLSDGLIDGPKTVFVPIQLIDRAKYNPQNIDRPHLQRDSEMGTHVQRLAASMKTVGQLIPVSLYPMPNGRYHLNDGHCRLSAAKLNNFSHLLALLSGVEPTTAYRIINGYTKPHSSNEKLCSFMVDESTSDGYCRVAYQNMVNHVGKKLIKKMAMSGYSKKTYEQAVKLAAYCNRTDDAYIAKVLNWIMEFRQTRKVRHAIEQKVSVVVIIWAIEEGQKLS